MLHCIALRRLNKENGTERTVSTADAALGPKIKK
jgi:hypothetical protein